MYLTPLASPSCLGDIANFSATFLIGTWLAEWFGNNTSACEFWPFILLLGGVVQFICGIFSIK